MYVGSLISLISTSLPALNGVWKYATQTYPAGRGMIMSGDGSWFIFVGINANLIYVNVGTIVSNVAAYAHNSTKSLTSSNNIGGC